MSLRDIGFALLVILIWAANLIAIKFVVAELDPIVALSVRFAGAALMLAPFFRWPGREIFIKLALVAFVLGFLHQGLLIIGMKYLHAGITGILLQSQVIFATFFGMMFFDEKIGWRTMSGLILGAAGIISFYGAPDAGFTIIGFWLILSSSLFMALAYILMKKLPPVNPLHFGFVQHIVSLPFLIITSLLISPHGWSALGVAHSHMLYGAMIFQIVIVSLSHALWQKLLARNPLSVVTPFILLMPVVTAIMALFLLDEPITHSMLIGGGLTIAGVGIIIVRRAQKAAVIMAALD